MIKLVAGSITLLVMTVDPVEILRFWIRPAVIVLVLTIMLHYKVITRASVTTVTSSLNRTLASPALAWAIWRRFCPTLAFAPVLLKIRNWSITSVNVKLVICPSEVHVFPAQVF